MLASLRRQSSAIGSRTGWRICVRNESGTRLRSEPCWGGGGGRLGCRAPGAGGVVGALNARGETSSSDDVDDDWLVNGEASR